MIGADGRARTGRQTSQAILRTIDQNAGWNGLADWLGKKKRPEFLSYEEAKKVVNALGLKGWDDWQRWSCTGRQTSQAILGKPIKMQVGMDCGLVRKE